MTLSTTIDASSSIYQRLASMDTAHPCKRVGCVYGHMINIVSTHIL